MSLEETPEPTKKVRQTPILLKKTKNKNKKKQVAAAGRNQPVGTTRCAISASVFSAKINGLRTHTGEN